MANFWEAAPLVEPQATTPIPINQPRFWEAAPLASGPAGINMTKGAPPNVRMDVGAAQTEADRLKTIKQFYPDAQPYGKDNFVFKDPETGQLTLYNEVNPKVLGVPVPTVGDFASIARDVSQGVGGTLGGLAGGIAGVAAAPFTAGASVPAGVAIGAGAGAAGTGVIYDAIRQLRGMPDTRSAGTRMLDTAVDFGANAVGQRAGDIAPELLGRAISGRNNLAGTTPSETLQAFRDLGVQPTAGQATGNRVLQGVEQAASKLPTGATTMQNTYAGQVDDLGRALGGIRSGYGASDSTTEAGRALQRGAVGFVERFKETTGRLYDALDKYLPGDALVSVANTMASLGGAASKFSAAPEIGKAVQNPKLRTYYEAFLSDMGADPNAPLPYSVVKAFRTKIGNDISDPMVVADVPRAELKQLYAALSQDMREAAKQAGPSALMLFDRANAYNAAGMKRIETFVGDLVKSGTPEEAYRYAMGQAKDGATRLFALRRSMDQDQWGVLASEVLRKMGEPTPGTAGVQSSFSPAKFLTEFSKLSESGAADALFKGTPYAALVPKLESLAKVSAAIKDTAAMANPSGTASANVYMNILTGGAIGAGASSLSGNDPITGAAAGVVGPYAAAKLMTSPKFVDWLVSASKGGSGPNAGGFIANISRLLAIAETTDPQTRDAIHNYAKAAGAALENAMPRSAEAFVPKGSAR